MHVHNHLLARPLREQSVVQLELYMVVPVLLHGSFQPPIQASFLCLTYVSCCRPDPGAVI